jgi:hypothetical protein
MEENVYCVVVYNEEGETEVHAHFPHSFDGLSEALAMTDLYAGPEYASASSATYGEFDAIFDGEAEYALAQWSKTHADAAGVVHKRAAFLEYAKENDKKEK